jgi:hypothetical protein
MPKRIDGALQSTQARSMSRAATKKAKARTRPIYLRCERLVRPETGEEVRGWIALTKWDARSMKDRKYHVGSEVRAEFRRPRNVRFHRLVHAIGTLCVEQIESFEGMDAHSAIKRLQSEAELFCDTEYIDASPVVATILAIVRSVLGEAAAQMLSKVLPTIKKVAVKVPRSIAFDELDETEFQELAAGIYRHLQREYWPSMTEEAIALMVEMFERDS